ncbi:MAG: hypothetical protein DSY35_04860 [Desulfurobacterium sp.]|nr:MAG: hypothetical protein DSY35_04860 [Desulfurobacterium sp.]
MNKSLILSVLLSLTLHLFVLSFLLQQEVIKTPVNQEESVTLSFMLSSSEKKREKPPHQSLQNLPRTQKTLKPPKKPKRRKEIKPTKSSPPPNRKKASEKTHKEEVPEKNTQSSPSPKKPSKLKGTQGKGEKREAQKPTPQESQVEPRPFPTLKKRFNREKYISLLVAEIERRKFYPPIARRMGIEGIVKVKITLDRTGKLKEVKVVSSSGSKILDRATVKLMKKCRFPPLPPEYNGEEFSVEVPIRYTLR